MFQNAIIPTIDGPSSHTGADPRFPRSGALRGGGGGSLT